MMSLSRSLSQQGFIVHRVSRDQGTLKLLNGKTGKTVTCPSSKTTSKATSQSNSKTAAPANGNNPNQPNASGTKAEAVDSASSKAAQETANASSKNDTSTTERPPLDRTAVNTDEKLEKAIVAILRDQGRMPVNVGVVAAEFQKRYGQTLKEALKQLNRSQKLPVFFKACKALEIKQQEKLWFISLR
jgi:hypothetical protein